MGLVASSQRLIFRGRVIDVETNMPLKYANIYILDENKGMNTKDDGSFAIELTSGEYTFRVSMLGYYTQDKKIILSTKTPYLTIYMRRDIKVMKEANIVGRLPKESVLKTGLSPLNVPVSYSYLDRAFIEQTKTIDINDLMKYTTGIYGEKAYGVKQKFTMRGFGQAVVMIDGARDENYSSDPYAGVMTSLSSVERVEYLKGPASVLYGHSAVGGILNVVRKKPLQAFMGNVTASYGSWNTRNVNIDLGGKLAEDLSYRFDVSTYKSDGWRKSFKEYTNAYLALDYKINEANRLELRFGANDDKYTPDGGIPFVADTIWDMNNKVIYKKGDMIKGIKYNQRYSSNQDYMSSRNYNAAAKYTYKFSEDSKLSLHTSFIYDDMKYLNTGEGFVFTKSKKPNAKMKYYGTDRFITLDSLNQASVYSHSTITKTLQNYLEYSTKFNTGEVKHNLLAGYNLMFMRRNIFYPYTYSGPGYNANVNIHNPHTDQGYIKGDYAGSSVYKEISNGLYLQDMVEITPKLKAMASFRLDHYSYNSKRENVIEHRTTTDTVKYKTAKNFALTYKAGIVYNPIENLALYASYSSFFKPIRISYNPDYVYFDKDGNQFYPEEGKKVFAPEEGSQYEIGLKYVVNRLLQVNLSTYIIQKENMRQYFGKNSEGKYIYAQTGKMKSQGIDFDAVISPTKYFSIMTGYSYVDAKYEENSKVELGKNRYAGLSVPRLPKHKFYTWMYYSVPKGILKDFSLGLGANYSSKMNSSILDSSSIDMLGRWVFDASISYEINKISLGLKMNNIFNKQYYDVAASSNQFIPAEERNFLITLAVRF